MVTSEALPAPLGAKAVWSLLGYGLTAGALLFALTHFGPLAHGASAAVLAVAAAAMTLAALGLTRHSRTRGLFVPFVLTSAFVLVRAWSFLPTVPVLFMDSPGYLAAPGLDTFKRPFTVPLLNHLLQQGHLKIVFFQYLLALGAWLALGLAVYRLLRPGYERGIVMALVLAMGLSHTVIRWDAFILSESDAHSLLILSLAVAMFFHGHFRRATRLGVTSYGLLGALFALIFLEVNTRDASVYLVPFFAVFIALYAWKARIPRPVSAAALAALIVICGLQLRLSHDSQRWGGVLANVFLIRVLPDSDRTAYFVARGMPVDDALRARAGQPFWRNGFQTKSPAFVAWLQEQGKPAYMGYLIHQFPAVNGDMLRELPTVFTLSDFKRKWLHDEPGELFSQVAHTFDQVFFFKLPSVWFAPVWAALVVVLCVIPGTRGLAFSTLFLGVAAYSQVFIGYHGDAVDEGRHTVLGQLLFRLSLLSGGLALWRQAVRAVSARPGRPAGMSPYGEPIEVQR